MNECLLHTESFRYICNFIWTYHREMKEKLSISGNMYRIDGSSSDEVDYLLTCIDTLLQEGCKDEMEMDESCCESGECCGRQERDE